jgi:MFS family permease
VLPWTASPLFVAPVAGLLTDRIGSRPILAAGMLLQGVGLGWFALLSTTGVAYGQLVVPLMVAGIGISMALPVAQQLQAEAKAA